MVTRDEPATKAWSEGVPALVADKASIISTAPKGEEQGWMPQEPGRQDYSPACRLAGWATRNPGAAEVLSKRWENKPLGDHGG